MRQLGLAVGAVFIAGALLVLPRLADDSTHVAAQTAAEDRMLRWMAGHRGNVGFVLLAGDESVIDINGGDRFALASTIKVLILGAYAEAVVAGDLDPAQQVPVGDIERWYLRGTDGGAHERAKREWYGDTVSLDQSARAMIRWSDNAATDYLLRRVGGHPQVSGFARRMGMTGQEPPVSVFGMFVAWRTHDHDEWLAMSPERRADFSREVADATSVAEAERAGAFGGVRDVAGQSPAGRPRDWARLMQSLSSGQGMAPSAAAIMRRHLEWPMEFKGNQAKYAHLGAKGGSLPGVLTDAIYVESRVDVRSKVAAALFFRNLPPDIEADFKRSFAGQQLIVRMLQHRNRQRLARRLG